MEHEERRIAFLDSELPEQVGDVIKLLNDELGNFKLLMSLIVNTEEHWTDSEEAIENNICIGKRALQHIAFAENALFKLENLKIRLAE